MIDVMLILLVFFMVTSTYLNLDMIPAVDQGDDSVGAPATATQNAAPPVLIRLGADGVPTIQGRALDTAALEMLLQDRVQADPFTRILILPSGAADMQALVALMDTATRMGATNVSVIRLEGTQ
jgi:biopolymer transport protein ExbD